MPPPPLLNPILNTIQKPHDALIAICGPADTGKTTIAHQICKELTLKGLNCETISTDSFLIDRVERINKGISGYNPDALKAEDLIRFVDTIKAKEEVRYFPYDSSIGANSAQFRVFKAVEVLIIEGIHAFHASLLDKTELKIFIDADDATLRQLRFKANITKRGFSEQEAQQRIEMEMNEYAHYLEPLKKHAEVIIQVDDEYNYR